MSLWYCSRSVLSRIIGTIFVLQKILQFGKKPKVENTEINHLEVQYKGTICYEVLSYLSPTLRSGAFSKSKRGKLRQSLLGRDLKATISYTRQFAKKRNEIVPPTPKKYFNKVLLAVKFMKYKTRLGSFHYSVFEIQLPKPKQTLSKIKYGHFSSKWQF